MKIKNNKQAVKTAMKFIKDYNKEHIIGLYLGTDNELRAKELISLGTLEGSVLHPREVLKPAICDGAVGMIILHNHPSSNIKPSPIDLTATGNLVKACRLLHLELLDSIIFNEKGDYYSIKEKHKKLWKEGD